MAYATLTDLYAKGAPVEAFGKVPPSAQSSALEDVASLTDSKLRGRYPDAVPLMAPIDPEIVRVNCVIAAYRLIVGIRGAQPSGVDIAALKQRHDEAVMWLDQVQRQAAHPLITAPPGVSPQRALPRVSSGTPRGI